MIWKLRNWKTYHYVMCIGFAVWCISGLAIYWFVFDNWDIAILKTWYDSPPMAIEAAICFMLIGIAIYMIGLSGLRSHEHKHDETKPDSTQKHIENPDEKQ